MAKKIVLGFSGGLDTSFCVKYLTEDLGYEVHAVTIDTGGFGEKELKEIEARALSLGAKSYKNINALESYYKKVVKYLIFGNILKNNTYPLSVSAERITQAVMIANYAKKLEADAIAHGSTGAGNDQVRFDMVFQILMPGVEVITPIRDLKLSREQEIAYLIEKGVSMDFAKNKYSINKGLWGTSVGGSETLTSEKFLPEDAFPTKMTKNGSEDLKLYFVKGELKAINDQSFESSVQAIEFLQEIAGPFGIGRDIHVGDTIIGIKGRVGFEAAAPLIIVKAHHQLEKHVLTKWQLSWKDQIAQFYGNYLHEGQLLDPVMRDMEHFMESTQDKVTGEVYITLNPYYFRINGIHSAHDLMGGKFGTYGEMNNGWTGDDVRGFTKIFGNQVGIYFSVNEEEYK